MASQLQVTGILARPNGREHAPRTGRRAREEAAGAPFAVHPAPASKAGRSSPRPSPSTPWPALTLNVTERFIPARAGGPGAGRAGRAVYRFI